MNIYLIGIFISFVVYLIVSVLIGRKVKTANDFYVAGRRAPLVLIVGSMIASYVSTGLFLGDAAEFYNGIFSPMIILAFMQVVGYIYGAIFFGRYLRRSEVYTIPQFFGKRFCSEAVRKLSTITSIIMMIVYLLSVMQGIGTLMNVITGVDYKLCIFISLIVFVFITMFSGAKGVLITDTIMFSLFTGALVLASFIIIKNAGGWYNVVDSVTQLANKPGIMDWGGNTNYLYSSKIMNVVWGLIYGIVWMSVCMAGPWQSSRYMMAKNEHTIVRSSLYIAFGVFVLELLTGLASVSMNVYTSTYPDPSKILIYASMEVLPTIVGVILLTGVLAAGISSATTFLSLIGSSIANDIYRGKKNTIGISRISMFFVSMIVMVLAMTNPPQIRVILYFGGTIVAASWMPACFASILSKRVTKTGIFCGMLFGFVGCFIMKLVPDALGWSLPVYLDPTVVGIVLNVFSMFIGSLLTKVTPEEVEARNKLFIVPESEKNPHDIKITKRYIKGTILLGVIITITLIFVWVIPVWR